MTEQQPLSDWLAAGGWLLFVTAAAVGLSSSSADADPSKTATPPENELPTLEATLSEASGSPIRLLEGGGQIELLAIGAHGESDRVWWASSGERLDRLPFETCDATNISPLPNRQLVFQSRGLTPDAAVVWSTKPISNSSSATVIVNGVKDPPDRHSHVFEAPRGGDPFTLKVGVASGDWLTFTTDNARGSSAVSILNKSVVFSGRLMNESGDAVIVVSHNLRPAQVRLVAISTAGESIPASRVGGGSAGQMNLTHFTFTGLQPSEIDHVELQYRLYEWVTFDGLPAHPKPTAAVGSTTNASEAN